MVYLDKQLSSGQCESVPVESDAHFYRRFARRNLTGPHRILNNFFFVTNRCNLNCAVCYEGKRDIGEPTLEELAAALPQMRGPRVAMCGAEPTMRKDLSEIVRLIKRRHEPLLMTNGLKLASMAYLRQLREAGLHYVVLSLNGLSDDVYRRTNDQELVEPKLKALENCRRLGMSVHLSATITRGLNEDQIGPLLDLADRTENVLQVRFRAMSPVGNYLDGGELFMSELVKIICKHGRIDYDLWCRQQDFFDHLGRTIGVDHIRPRLCAMRADLTHDRVPFAAEWNWEQWQRARWRSLRVFARLIECYGWSYALSYLHSLMARYRYTPHPGFRRIAVRVWPNLQTMDIELNKRCTSLYHREGQAVPFCLCNVMHNDLA
jgi:pyruvate-formate lyase-activating enzyme